MKPAYYNEHDLYAAQWLRNLIAAGHIAPGDVDTRSIEDVKPDDLRPYTQCHFFAGIGVWSLALRRAGWADDRPIWTGSAPCQPFSAAGQGAAFADERHLWPAFFHLIAQCRPSVVVGEQVAGKDANAWIDLVQADMEALGHAFGAVAFPSAGVGAPHIRDRTYWVADAAGGRDIAGIARTDQRGLSTGDGGYQECTEPGPTNGLWRDVDWLACRDGKWRPVSPLPQPLVDGSSESLGRVRSETITTIEEEVNAATAQAEGGRAAAMRALLETLGEEAKRSWPPGGFPGLHEAPFLLAFVRQLQKQGWNIAEGVSLPRAETSSGILRGLRDDATVAGASHRRELDEQRSGEPADPVRVLSRILARHACAAWDAAYAAHAETGFPLTHGARSRVGRLRAYGNAINVEAARVFIDAFVNSAYNTNS